YFNFEYRFLLSRRTFVFGFYDLGYYYKPPLRTVSSEFPEPEFAAWRRGVGFGARVESPLGILSISYALGDGDNLLRGKVHFGLQNDF
ncbi:MAG: hypothetical protein IAF08_09635, partial [Rhizobacter sp.]|nr:hypothetical protein [Chlorobiales bacterium]